MDRDDEHPTHKAASHRKPKGSTRKDKAKPEEMQSILLSPDGNPPPSQSSRTSKFTDLEAGEIEMAPREGRRKKKMGKKQSKREADSDDDLIRMVKLITGATICIGSVLATAVLIVGATPKLRGALV